MQHILTCSPRRVLHAVESFFAHVAAIVIGFTMMIAGLGLGVTMVMLPVGVVVGLMGLAIFIGGLFARFVYMRRHNSLATAARE